MKPAALGFRVHSGWAALVAVTVEERFPILLLRERPHLVETFTFEFRQPYHTAKRRSLDEARDFITRSRTEAGVMADGAIQSAREKLKSQGYELQASGLLAASARPLPELSRILASHALIHTADGELFREALLDACKRHGLPTLTIRESELLERACHAMHLSSERLAERLSELGRAQGSPWTKDEKLATLAAGLCLL